MAKIVHLDASMVPEELRGSYTGKRFKAVITDKVTIPAIAGMWSGGAREIWDLITLDKRERLSNGDAAWAGIQREQTIELKPGMAVRRYYDSVGFKQLTFYIHPDTATKLLPAPAPELTLFEQEVLRCSKKYKPSYNGKDRYEMSQADAHYKFYNAPKMTRKEWELAKSSLIRKKLLNKAGAITIAGRNAIESISA